MFLTFPSAIFILSALTLLSHALPLKSHESNLRIRIPYKVVAVDGGSDAAPSSSDNPIITTILSTTDEVKTVTASASTPPPSTEIIVTTKTVEGLEPAQTTDSAAYQASMTTIHEPITTSNPTVIDAVKDSATVVITQSTTASIIIGYTSSTSETTLAIIPYSTTTPIKAPSTTALVTATSSQSFTSVTASQTEIPATTENAVDTHWIPSPVPTVSPSTTQAVTITKSYDNGLWHTSYPPWNASSTLSISSTMTTTSIISYS